MSDYELVEYLIDYFSWCEQRIDNSDLVFVNRMQVKVQTHISVSWDERQALEEIAERVIHADQN